jgi:ribose-phosphate pyrophosphokinase
MDSDVPFSPNGGLTLIPTPGFEEFTEKIKKRIEEMGNSHNRMRTPTDLVKPDFGLHANREPYLRLGKDHIGEHDCVVITSGPGTSEVRDQLGMALWYLVGRRAKRITVVSPYFPIARSDKDEGRDILALAKYVVHMMAAASCGELNRIVSFDLHSPQIVLAGPKPGYITPVSMVRRLLQRTIEDARKFTDNIFISNPDDGATKRMKESYDEIKERLGLKLPCVLARKRRADSETSSCEEILGDTQEIKGSIVISLDDEIATGGTLIESAAELKSRFGVSQVWGAVTHGVFCGRAVENFSRHDCPVDRIYSSDTIPFDRRIQFGPLIESRRLRIVSCVDDVAKMIYFAHWGFDIREMR